MGDQLELERKELIEHIAEYEVELQKLKMRLLEVQNQQMQAHIERKRSEKTG